MKSSSVQQTRRQAKRSDKNKPSLTTIKHLPIFVLLLGYINSCQSIKVTEWKYDSAISCLSIKGFHYKM